MKDFFGKIGSWIKEHKTQSIIILVATVIAVSCAITIPLCVKASKEVIKDECTLTVVSEDVNKGTVSGGGAYENGTSVTITVTPNIGYVFEGWYLDETKVSSSTTYTVSVSNNVTYVAKFDIQKFTLTVIDETHSVYLYSAMGVVSQTIEDRTFIYSIPVGQSITLTCHLNPLPAAGAAFDGWFKDGHLITDDLNYTFTMPAENVTITVRAHSDFYNNN